MASCNHTEKPGFSWLGSPIFSFVFKQIFQFLIYYIQNMIFFLVFWKRTAYIWPAFLRFQPQNTGFLVIKIGHFFSSFLGNYFSLLLHQNMKNKHGDTLLIYGQLQPYISTFSATRPPKHSETPGLSYLKSTNFFPRSQAITWTFYYVKA